MYQNGPVATDQKGVAQAIEVQRIDNLRHRSKAQVAAHHIVARRSCDGHDQHAGCSINIGAGEYGLAALTRCLEPGARPGIIACRHLGVRAHGKAAIAATQVAELEGLREGTLLQQRHQPLWRLALQVLCKVLQQQNTARQPITDVVCRQRPGIA